MPLPYGVEQHAHEEFIEVSIAARLHQRNIAVVVGVIADRLYRRAHAGAFHFGHAQPEVLLHARTDGHALFITFTFVYWHQWHVHERRFTRLIEAAARYHGGMPIQNFFIRSASCGFANRFRGGNSQVLPARQPPPIQSITARHHQERRDQYCKTFLARHHGCSPVGFVTTEGGAVPSFVLGARTSCGKRNAGRARRRAAAAAGGGAGGRAAKAARRAASTSESAVLPPR